MDSSTIFCNDNLFDTDFSSIYNDNSTLIRIQSDIEMIKRNQIDFQTSTSEQKQVIQNIEVAVQQLANDQKRIFSLLELLVQQHQTTKFDQRPSSINRSQERLPLTINQTNSKKSINDFVLSKANNGTLPLSQWCCEINVGTTDDAPALITSSAHVSASSSQVQNISNNSMTYELSRQIQLVNTEQKISFLHPFDERIRAQTDRGTILKDIYGQPPVLVLNGCRFPVDTQIEIAPVSCSENGVFFGLFQFHDKTDGYKRFECRSIDFTDTNCQRIKLDNLKLCKICNNDMKIDGRFALQSYPSNETICTSIYSPKDLISQYKLDRVQIAIRIRRGDEILFKDILYSNCLTTEGKTKLLNSYEWKVDPLFSCINQFSFDSNNEIQMDFRIEIPREFRGTIDSGLKRLRVSLVTNGQPSLLYSISPEVVSIPAESFELNLKVRKKTLEEFCNNREGNMSWFEQLTIDNSNFNGILQSYNLQNFNIRLSIFHQDNIPFGETKIYEKCPIWQSDKFIEMTNNTAQKRTYEQMDELR